MPNEKKRAKVYIMNNVRVHRMHVGNMTSQEARGYRKDVSARGKVIQEENPKIQNAKLAGPNFVGCVRFVTFVEEENLDAPGHRSTLDSGSWASRSDFTVGKTHPNFRPRRRCKSISRAGITPIRTVWMMRSCGRRWAPPILPCNNNLGNG